MALNQYGYNFHPNDRVWYFDATLSSYKEGTVYQTEIKVFKEADLTIDDTLIYLVAIDGSPNPLRLLASQLFVESNLGLVQGPISPIYNALYDYAPTTNVWVVNRANTSVRYGTVYQAELKIFAKPNLTSETKITYYISYSDNSGTIRASQEDVFATSTAAWAALGITIGPAPTPVPTGTLVPGTNVITVSKINSDSITLYKGMPVYIKSDGTIARSDNDTKALTFLGFVYDDSIPVDGLGQIMTEGVMTNTTQNWYNVVLGAATIANVPFYLNGLGTISATAPLTGFSREVGLGVSATEFDIRIMSPIGI